LAQQVRILCQYHIEASDQLVSRHRAKTKEDDASMWPRLTDYQLTEIPIVRDHDALLSYGDGQDLHVLE